MIKVCDTFLLVNRQSNMILRTKYEEVVEIKIKFAGANNLRQNLNLKYSDDQIIEDSLSSRKLVGLNLQTI